MISLRNNLASLGAGLALLGAGCGDNQHDVPDSYHFQGTFSGYEINIQWAQRTISLEKKGHGYVTASDKDGDGILRITSWTWLRTPYMDFNDIVGLPRQTMPGDKRKQAVLKSLQQLYSAAERGNRAALANR